MTKNIQYFYIVDKKIEYEATLWPEILGRCCSSYNNIFYFDIYIYVLWAKIGLLLEF